MRHYYIECDYCGEETQVSSSSQEEPNFCAICGTEANSELIDESDDSEWE